MQTIINIYKPLGCTPLAALDRFRQLHPAYGQMKMTYAGRLDPAAEGVLLALAGDSVHDKDACLKLDKHYRAQILLGVTTDSYDVLGLVQQTYESVDASKVTQILKSLTGTHTFAYPPYSSKPVNGQPLFWWANQGRLHEIEIPQRVMTVYEARITDLRPITPAAIMLEVTAKINLVKGDFRQAESLQTWQAKLSPTKSNFSLITVDFHVASGTYIRSLAYELGSRLNCGAVLFALERTAVGDYTSAQALRL